MRLRIHVFRYKGKYGDGLVFVNEENKYKYLYCGSDWEYLGTLSEFIKKVKEEVAKKGEVGFWWEG